MVIKLKKYEPKVQSTHMDLELTLLDHLGIKCGTFPSICLPLFDPAHVCDNEAVFLDPCCSTLEALILDEDTAYPLEYGPPKPH
jgi:hypothetical protein